MLYTYDTLYDMAALFPYVDVTTETDLLVRPGRQTVIPDFLDQGYLNILNGIRAWTSDTYVGQKFTTMCYQHQGTTSLWSFNLAFNGLSHPCELVAGMQVRFPLMSEVARLLNLKNVSASPVGGVVVL